MTKDQIEQQSKLIEACRMIGATFKGDSIVFASGLAATITENVEGRVLDHKLFISYKDTVAEIYGYLLDYLTFNDPKAN